MKNKVRDGLFVGSKHAATDVSDFNMIVNVTTDVPFADPNKVCIRVPVLDIGVESQQEIMFSSFPSVCTRIQEQLKDGQVLVHCSEGKQRSCTIIVAYLIWLNNWNTTTAIKELKKSHPQAFADSSVHFLASLQRWEGACRTRVNLPT